MQKIVINGATGYAASYFIKELLLRNYKVVSLARNSNNIPAERRVKNVLEKIGTEQSLNLNNLKVYNYSLLKKDYGLPEKTLKEIFEGDIDFFHFAACLKFETKNLKRLTSKPGDEVTVESLQKMLKYFIIEQSGIKKDI